ncbi:unnamed protein product [Staurois parvus]|uniref:Uncharacterized protein n=1 Tax=Staurois parvus TaxID=386267 RepID=A0ABN9G7S4_9NEOB|nr:unnamed protein product [Staurois parvus]
MSLFVIFEFPAVPSPYVPTLAGDGTLMTDAGIRRISLPGTLQEGHCGSAGQGNDRGIVEQCSMVFPSVARGYRLCYTREYRQGG